MPDKNAEKDVFDELQTQQLVARRAIGGESPAETTRRILKERDALLRGAYYLGGGSVYIEAFGRVCFCSGCSIEERGARDRGRHSSACDDLTAAVMSALGGAASPDPENTTPAAVAVLDYARRIEAGAGRFVRVEVPCPACDGSATMEVTFGAGDEADAEYVGGTDQCDCELTEAGWNLLEAAAISSAVATYIIGKPSECVVDGQPCAGLADWTTGDCGSPMHTYCKDTHVQSCDVCSKYVEARAARGRAFFASMGGQPTARLDEAGEEREGG
jgi:hypothetical protein